MGVWTPLLGCPSLGHGRASLGELTAPRPRRRDVTNDGNASGRGVRVTPERPAARVVVTEERGGGRHKGTETMMSGPARALVARRRPEACARHGRRAATPLRRQRAFHRVSPVRQKVSSAAASRSLAPSKPARYFSTGTIKAD